MRIRPVQGLNETLAYVVSAVFTLFGAAFFPSCRQSGGRSDPNRRLFHIQRLARCSAGMNRPFVAFHFGLVQDVAVLRPLIRLAASLPSIDLHFLVSGNFDALDQEGRWRNEIDRLASEVGVAPLTYASVFEVLAHLGSGRGMVIAGSESNVRAHADAHELFRSLPGRIRSVTLQHGLECVGFVHNARHDATSGRNVRFAADIAVAWFALERMTSVSATERSKLFVAGPTLLLDPPGRDTQVHSEAPGMICENLHSVRFVNGRMREVFLETFTGFANRLAMVGQSLVLRAHPAGRFTERNEIVLPDNVSVSREPLYDLNLREFAFVISAPSTILLDFVLAGVPAATWVDDDNIVDTSNFAGLSTVVTVEDWWRFNWAARWEREAIVARQEDFRDGLGLPTNVRQRYESLLALA